MIASRIFFLMSSIFCLFSVSLKPLTCNILICLTIVDFPDSPAPSNSSRCVARYTCLSFCNCRVMASLRLFWDLESSDVCPLEPWEPKQPMAHARGPHQQPPPPSAPTAPPAPPPCPVACPVATAAVFYLEHNTPDTYHLWYEWATTSAAPVAYLALQTNHSSRFFMCTSTPFSVHFHRINGCDPAGLSPRLDTVFRPRSRERRTIAITRVRLFVYPSHGHKTTFLEQRQCQYRSQINADR